MSPVRPRSCLLTLFSAALIASGGGAAAQVFVDLNAPGPVHDGSSWASAFLTVQEGIDAADPLDQEVWVADGTYTDAVTLASGVHVYGGFTGSSGLEETQLSERDVAANPVILDADQLLDHIVTLDGVADSRLDGFTLTDALADGASQETNGGGLFIVDSGETNVIANCLLFANQATDDGGAIYMSNSSPEVVACRIVSNTADVGGGVALDAGSSPAFRDCVFAGNFGNAPGGAVAAANGSNATFVNCLFAGNMTVGQGGAVLAVLGSDLTFTNCTFRGNRSIEGGAIWADTESDCLLVNSIFEDNVSGAISENSGDSDFTVTNCLFFDNPDGDFFDENAVFRNGALVINFVAGNSGNVDGDPRHAMDGPNRVAGMWTSLPLYGGPVLNRSLLTDASAEFTPNEFAGSYIIPNAPNRFAALIESNTSTEIVTVGNVTNVPWFATTGSPYVIVDLHPEAGTAAADTGTAAGAPATDLDGVARPQGIGFDIGVYESVSRVEGAPAAVDFGPQGLTSGPSAPRTVTITNTGAGAALFTGAGFAITGADASSFAITNAPATAPLTGGASREVAIVFDPSTLGAKSATLEVTTDDLVSPTLIIALSGLGGEQDIDAAPASLSFGGQDIDGGPSAPLAVAISNTGTAPLAIASVTVTGANASDFAISADTGETTIAPGASREVQVVFDPSALGASTAALTVASDDPDEPALVVPLDGTGTDQNITVSPASLSFGDQAISAGASAAQAVTISNTGTADLTIASVTVTGTGASEFAVSADTGEATLAPGASREVEVVFDPENSGARAASLDIASDDADEPLVSVALDGSGFRSLEELVDRLLGLITSAAPFSELDLNTDGVFDAADVVTEVNSGP